MFFRPARLLPWFALLALGLVFCSGPAHASIRLQTSNIDWSVIASTGNVRFHLRFDNPDPSPSPAATGTLRPQAYGAFLPDLNPVRSFDVPPIPPNGAADVFTEIPLQLLPPSAPTAGGPPAGGPCPPPGTWNGNVHVTWNNPNGQGQAFRHMGQVLVCPGNACTFIHVMTDCAAPAPWSIAGLCPGFNATLYEEDQTTPSPNPVPPNWHGWLCISAVSGTPVPTTCCIALSFSCAGQPGIVELCATTCDCNPTGANPVPGLIDWTTLPGNIVRFHVRWDNPSPQPSAPISGQMNSQMFGVFQPDFGPIGAFSVPAVQSNGSFDVFSDVPLDQLPPEPSKPGAPPPTGPCPPDKHWDGNVDLSWSGPAGAGVVMKHIAHLVVCPGSGASLIHIGFLACGSAIGEPWSISGLCPGFTATLVNADSTTPAPNPVPPGWSGFISVSAAAFTPVPDTCCFRVTFMCDSVPGVIDLCAITCDCAQPPPPHPVPGRIDWNTLPGGDKVRFHIRWENPSSSQDTGPISGNMLSQRFGAFLPSFGTIGQFNVPAMTPDSFFDVFFDVAMDSLPPQPPQQLPGGGPPPTGPCPPDDHWDGNVDVTWGGPGGSGTVNKHVGTVLLNSGGGRSYIHVISGCALASGTTWSLGLPCPGFTALLVNEDHSPAPAVLPPNWTGWIAFSAPGVAPGTTCCLDLTLQCGSETAVIEICGVVCYWGTLDVGHESDAVAFGIRSVMPNPSGGPVSVGFVLPLTQHARLEVFDAAGHRVRTVADGAFVAGAHIVAWDGRDARGNRARPGTYFLRLNAGERSANHKLVLR